MSFQSACQSWELAQKEELQYATFGHLAPRKNKTYKGHIVWALGCLGDDHLNPTILDFKLGSLSSSPWFFNSASDFLSTISSESGTVWRWEGTFRNYKFIGKFQQISISGLPGFTKDRYSSKLTRKHFEKIAEEIRSLPSNKREQRLCQVIPELKNSNPRFNEQRFRNAVLC